jgi:DNA-binding HxlR family transcriptional regulator
VPRTTRLDTMRCSVARTLDVIGEWWTMLIMRDAFKGVTRFEDFHRNLGIARTVLSARLDRLVEAGIFIRRAYSDHPPRSEYVLTEKGRDLFPVLVTLMQWGDRWAADDGPPLLLVHEPCEHVTSPRLVCEHCDGDVALDTVRAEPS